MIPVVPPKKRVKKSKEQLNAESSKFKEAIENQIESIKQKGFNIGKIALIAGGVAFAGYILVDLLTGKKKKKVNKDAIIKIDTSNLPEKEKKEDSFIVASIKSYIIAFLIGIAREKLLEALAEFKKDEAQPDIQ